MSELQWLELKKIDAKRSTDSLQHSYDMDEDPFHGRNFSLNQDYTEMRKQFLTLYENVKSEYKFGYEFDFEFGIGIYKILRFNYLMYESEASDDDIWRFIQLKVIPDIIMDRWPLREGKINSKRLYSEPQRIYLKILWWYIHILWEKDEVTTRSFKAKVDISQITDRSGYKGIRVEIFKEILHVYSLVEHDKTANLIEKVLMLNASYCTVLEPQLMDKSLNEYVVGLYRELGVDV